MCGGGVACCVGGVALWCGVAPYLFLLCGGVLSAGGVLAVCWRLVRHTSFSAGAVLFLCAGGVQVCARCVLASFRYVYFMCTSCVLHVVLAFFSFRLFPPLSRLSYLLV